MQYFWLADNVEYDAIDALYNGRTYTFYLNRPLLLQSQFLNIWININEILKCWLQTFCKQRRIKIWKSKFTKKNENLPCFILCKIEGIKIMMQTKHQAILFVV